jgi:DNA polymerase
MITENMQKITDFLDIAGDFLGSGYKSSQKIYQFEDSIKQADDIPLTIKNDNDTIESIEEEIRACKNCSLGSMRTNAAPGEGVSCPLVMVIGEGPGEDEDRQGRPFVGKAGQLLDKMLASIGLSRTENCFIANVIKCRPPNNRDPYPEEVSACSRFLERQINLLKPKCILVAGRVAAQSLLGTTESIGKLRGKFMELKLETGVYKLIATYHPAALLRNEEYKRPSWEDLKLLKAKLEEQG